MNNIKSINDMIAASDPAQMIVWNEVFRRFGEKIAITPLYYVGVNETAPFFNLAARKVYLAYEISIGAYETRAAMCPLVFDDAAGNTIFTAYDQSLAVSPQRNINTLTIKNILFSRAQILNTTQGLSFFNFVGFAINH